MLRAFLDTCVLFPRVLRDSLLDAAVAELYLPLWSAAVLEELQRSLREHRRLATPAAASLIVAMDRFFPEANVIGYDALVPRMTNHPKDRHVLAAAVQGQADIIVTSNLSDFLENDLAPHGVVAISPDAFLQRLFDHDPAQMVKVLLHQAETYRQPAITIDESLDRLARFAPTLPARFHEER